MLKYQKLILCVSYSVGLHICQLWQLVPELNSKVKPNCAALLYWRILAFYCHSDVGGVSAGSVRTPTVNLSGFLFQRERSPSDQVTR